VAREQRTSAEGWKQIEFSRFGADAFRLPKTPFARLGLVHAVASAGDALVTIALAKTLFFVSLSEARPKVLTYLLLTLAPFTVVSPFIGPLIDRFAGSRRWVMLGSCVLRAVLCLLLVNDIRGSLLLFPEAFVLLVVSKGYAIAKSSIVPEVVRSNDELVKANSRLALIGGLAGFLIAPFGALVGIQGPDWVASLGAIVFIGAAILAFRLPSRVVDSGLETNPATKQVVTDTARDGSRSAPTRSARSLEVRQRRTALRLATLAMSVQRGLVGLITFLVAFSFKREGEPTWSLGLVAGAGIVGGLVGSVLAPKIVDRLGEARLLLGSAVGVAAIAAVSAFRSGIAASAVVASAIGLSAAMSRLAFDALVQRDSGHDQRGAAFAKLETRFQLSWVLGSLIPVAFPISRFVGFLLIAAVSGAVVAAIVGGEQSLERIDDTLAVGAAVWRRPVRPTADEWHSLDED
jgi:MFS family permease